MAARWRLAALAVTVAVGLIAGCAKRGAPSAVVPQAVATPPVVRPAATAAPTITFTDVPSGYWAAHAIDTLAQAGILQGIAPEQFAPAAGVTRAEFAAFLDRMARAPADTPGPSFSDVPSSAWFAPAVAVAAGNGWMDGAAPDRFAPNAPITRAQALVALVRYLGLGRVAASMANAPCHYRDCAVIPVWAAGAIAVSARLGLVRGQPSGAVDPLAPLDRAQAAVLLARALRVPPSQVQAAAAAVTTEVDLEASARTLAPGTAATITATARDASGDPVPDGFRFTLTGPAHLRVLGGGRARVTATGAGAIDLAVGVVGAPTVGRLALTAIAASRISLAEAPPAVLAGHALDLPVQVLTPQGQPDPVAAGSVAVTLTPTVAHAPTRIGLRGGKAVVALPGLTAGGHTLTLRMAGLPPESVTLRVVRQPLGEVGLSAPAMLASGARGTLVVTVPASAPWPVSLSVTGHPSGPDHLHGEAQAPTVLTLPGALMAQGAARVGLAAWTPGRAVVTASVPGGALAPARIQVPVAPTGAFGPTRATAPVRAGQTARLRITLEGHPTAVRLEPIDPAGHPLPTLAATLGAGQAWVDFTPVGAGTWHFRWYAPGWVPVQAGTLTVTPGAPVGLKVSAVPTSVLLPGERATLTATLVDRYGNPLPTAFAPRVAATPPGVTLTAMRGPGPIGQYVASAPGTTTLIVTAGAWPAATLTLRTVPDRAARVAGPGLWLTFPDWKDTPDATILAEARQLGATHIYLEVATSTDGFYGGRALDDLVWRAHAAGIAVIAWVYPSLTDPARDIRIARAVAAYRTPDGERADGLALDIEADLSPARVAAYARAVRQAVGHNGLVVGVTWPPQQKPDYPYQALAGAVDVLAPMDYWHTRAAPYTYAAVYRWVRASVVAVRQLAGRPTMPVDVALETFDWFSPTGTGRWSPSGEELKAALAAAAAAGATGDSFYRPTTATPAEWAVMRQGA